MEVAVRVGVVGWRHQKQPLRIEASQIRRRRYTVAHQVRNHHTLAHHSIATTAAAAAAAAAAKRAGKIFIQYLDWRRLEGADRIAVALDPSCQ